MGRAVLSDQRAMEGWQGVQEIEVPGSWIKLETFWVLQVLGANLFVRPISYVTGIEREQGTSGSNQQSCGGLLQQQC